MEEDGDVNYLTVQWDMFTTLLFVLHKQPNANSSPARVHVTVNTKNQKNKTIGVGVLSLLFVSVQ
jgi:hypothetical protein